MENDNKKNITYLNGEPYYGEGKAAELKSSFAKISVKGVVVTASTAFLGMCALGATFSLANVAAIAIRPEFQLLSADSIPWIAGSGMSIKAFKSTKEFLDRIKKGDEQKDISSETIVTK